MNNDDFDWFDMEENDFMQECEYGSNLEVLEMESEKNETNKGHKTGNNRNNN